MRNIFSAKKSGKYEGHFTHSIKRMTFQYKRTSTIFHGFLLKTKGVYQGDVRDYLGAREGINECLPLYSFAARSKYQTTGYWGSERLTTLCGFFL